MCTDPEFAEEVVTTQTRMGERIAGALVQKALGEGDVGAQMYLLKQYGSAIQLVDQEAQDIAQSRTTSTQGMDISRLPLEEQETLLRLMRKAQEGTEEPEIPEVEYESEEERTLIEQEVNTLITNEHDESEGTQDEPIVIIDEGD